MITFLIFQQGNGSINVIHLLQERRSLEKVAQRILGTIDHGSKMSIPTKSLAQAMMNNTFTMKEKSIEIIENAGIIKLSHKEA